MIRFASATVILLAAAIAQSAPVVQQSENNDRKKNHRVQTKVLLRHKTDDNNDKNIIIHNKNNDDVETCMNLGNSNTCELPTEYCSIDQGECLETNRGTCATMPTMCTLEEAPVCGCDGTTYGNKCSAASAGTSILHEGDCEDGNPCNPSTNPCSNTDVYFCSMKGGMCTDPASEQEGTCDQYGGATACPMNWSPVCGCDGVVYGNWCEAKANGVNVARGIDDSDGATAGGTCEIDEKEKEEESKTDNGNNGGRSGKNANKGQEGRNNEPISPPTPLPPEKKEHKAHEEDPKKREGHHPPGGKTHKEDPKKRGHLPPPPPPPRAVSS